MESLSDHDLVRQSLAGSADAFRQLVERHRAAILNLARRMTGDPDDALDVMQATFVKAYQSLSSFDTERKFFSWIYRIAIHESIDLIRRKKRRALLSEDHPDESGSPEDKYVASERARKLQAALMEIDDSARALVVLRYFADLSYAELGFVFDVPESRIKSRLYDARQNLTRQLDRHGLTAD